MSEPANVSVTLPPIQLKARSRIGLRFKILAALTVFNVIVTCIFTVNHYNVEKATVMVGIEDKLRAVALALPELLPVGYLDRAVTPEGIPEAEYMATLLKLNRYCDLSGIAYLYSYARTDKGFVCTSTNGTPEEMKKGEFTKYWDLYTDAPPSLAAAWDKNEPRSDDVKDEYGRHFSLFLPLQTAAGTRYIAGADFTISFVDEQLQASLKRTLLLGLGSFAVFFGISFFLATQLSRNIGLLADYTRELSTSNFKAHTNSPLRQQVTKVMEHNTDELGQLATSFIEMENRLVSYLHELRQTTAAKERFQNELKIAGDIQNSMLPHDFAPADATHRIELSAAMKPAKEAGGDLYDYFYLDDDHLCFCIGDVSDKGMPAAIFMTVAITILRAHATAQRIATPEDILFQTNELLIKQNAMYQFVTMFLGIINVRTGEVAYSDGGHNRPYLRRAGQAAHMLPPGGGIALGVMPGAGYKHHTLKLEAGDVLFLYTDGVTEAIAADESFYGEPRLESFLTALPADTTSAQWTERAMQSVFEFSKGHAQADDITILTLRFCPLA